DWVRTYVGPINSSPVASVTFHRNCAAPAASSMRCAVQLNSVPSWAVTKIVGTLESGASSGILSGARRRAGEGTTQRRWASRQGGFAARVAAQLIIVALDRGPRKENLARPPIVATVWLQMTVALQ